MPVISGGTTLIDNGTLDSGVAVGKLTLISTQTASSSSSISFTSGIDSTYDSYIFKFINIHASSNDATFRINFSTDSGSNYNVSKTTTFFRTYNNESGGTQSLLYATSHDAAESTSDIDIITSNGTGNDESASGTLQMFNPSSTVTVKHFLSDCNVYHQGDLSQRLLVSGYGNTTSAVNAVRFQFSSGNIDSGKIKMYGVG